MGGAPLAWLFAIALALVAAGCGEDEEGSATMRPGEACLECHGADAGGEAPTFAFAGTVFDGQQGAEGVRVRVEDAEGRVEEVVSNAAGNFFSRAPLTPPFTVSLTAPGGATAAMPVAADHGDCNACHAAGGAAGGPLSAP
ncbi:MAG: carboxypeptidase regulatory-like domain-containing protein [Nitrospirae bacterium]|nr:MAG: carboxypeptidase regulatory-like domain-containing protein [Nitrospirota bacterium]